MKTTQPYRKWVGVLLGLLLHGSAHFLAGKRSTGFKWFFALFACNLSAMCTLAIPGKLPAIICTIIILTGVVLWLVMIKQSYAPVRRVGFLGWVAVIVISIAMHNAQIFIIRQCVQPFKIPTGAMQPTVIPGDHIFVERLSHHFSKPKRGDIVVFKTKGIKSLQQDTVYIKRIIGLPGDRIRIDPPYAFINDNKLLEPDIFATISRESEGYSGFQLGGKLSSSELEWPMAEDEYFVLGDNTTNSRDSRYWGAVPAKNIIGKVTRVYWPFTRINALNQ